MINEYVRGVEDTLDYVLFEISRLKAKCDAEKVLFEIEKLIKRKKGEILEGKASIFNREVFL